MNAAVQPNDLSVTALFEQQPSGKFAAHFGIDASGVGGAGEGKQRVWIDDHLLATNALRGELRDALRVLGFELGESGDHFVVGNLADALVILAPKPRIGDELGHDGPPSVVDSPMVAESLPGEQPGRDEASPQIAAERGDA